MSGYSKYNIIYRLQKWMDTVSGQTFLNYVYSWGASVVILGALFTLTHLPGANIMIFIGMGTEVFVFFISAFDRPFDKTAEGREMPTRLTEEYLETGKVSYDKESSAVPSSTPTSEGKMSESPVYNNVGGNAPQTIIIAGGSTSSASTQTSKTDSTVSSETPASGSSESSSVVGSSAPQQSATVVSPQPNFVPQMSEEEANALNEAQGNYVDELKTLVETLKKVNEQSTRLTRDSEEMENLNRTLTGISKIYEMQLKGASQQIGTIDQINAQTHKMAEQIEQLNKIYARMIEAMTVNMRAQAPQQPVQPGN